MYSITCDNGDSIVKMVKIFNENTEEDESEEVTNIVTVSGMFLKIKIMELLVI